MGNHPLSNIYPTEPEINKFLAYAKALIEEGRYIPTPGSKDFLYENMLFSYNMRSIPLALSVYDYVCAYKDKQHDDAAIYVFCRNTKIHDIVLWVQIELYILTLCDGDYIIISYGSRHEL